MQVNTSFFRTLWLLAVALLGHLVVQAQDPCVSTGTGLPYVSTNPNYVCEALDAFVYINVAQAYADPADAAAENFNFSWYPFDVLGGTSTQSFDMVFDSTITIWCVALDVPNNCIWTDTIVVQVQEAVNIGLPADTLVCDLNGFTLQPSAEAQAMAGCFLELGAFAFAVGSRDPHPSAACGSGPVVLRDGERGSFRTMHL